MMPGSLVFVVIVLSVGIGHCAPPDILSQIFADLKQNYREKLSDLHADFNRRDTQLASQNQHVAFYVETSTNWRASETIVYDVVPINTGSGYNTNAGTFTAPTSGTYIFTWSNTPMSSEMLTSLFVNGEELGQTHTSFQDRFQYAVQGSKSAILNLSEGDVVSIRGTPALGEWNPENALMTFAGSLVR